MTKPDNPSAKRQLWLLGEKERLERLIMDTTDEKAANALRADYRKVINELDAYFDDIPLKPIKK